MTPKYAKVVGSYKGHTPEIGILTVGEEIVTNWMWVVEMEVRGRETPCGIYVPTEEYLYLYPLWLRG